MYRSFIYLIGVCEQFLVCRRIPSGAAAVVPVPACPSLRSHRRSRVLDLVALLRASTLTDRFAIRMVANAVGLFLDGQTRIFVF